MHKNLWVVDSKIAQEPCTKLNDDGLPFLTTKEQHTLDQQLIQMLAERFYIISNTSGQSSYFDSLNQTDKGNYLYQLRDVVWDHEINEPHRQRTDPRPPDKMAHSVVYRTNFRSINLSRDFYRPNAPEVVSLNGVCFRNLWVDDGIKPSDSNDIKVWIDHLMMMMSSDKDKVNYLIDHLAYRMQKSCVTTKPHIAFYLYGHRHGCGKGLLGSTIEKVFGVSSVQFVSEENDLRDKSSVDWFRRTWLIAGEAKGKMGSGLVATMKERIGSSTTTAPKKNKDNQRYEIPAQVIMLSNHAPSFIEEQDRRWFISRFEPNPIITDKQLEDHLDRLTTWLEDDGYARIAKHLRERDISHIKLTKRAMVTDEKKEACAKASDVVAKQIELTVKRNPEQIVFMPSDFEDLFRENEVNINQHKHKMTSGDHLVMCKNERYHYEKMREYLVLYLRKGYQIIKVKGQKAILRCNYDRSLDSYLEDDIDFIRFFKIKSNYFPNHR